MGLTKKRSFFRDRHGRDYTTASQDKSTTSHFNPAPSLSTQGSDEHEALYNVPTDEELLKRAREAHTNVDFQWLATGPESNQEWKRIEATDQFAVYRRHVTISNNDKQRNGLEVICAGYIDASVEEVASILRSSSEAEHNTVMSGLYAKSFIFGSYEREVSCTNNQDDDDDDHDHDEQLSVKTKSFSRTTILGHNEQWCYSDYFQRKPGNSGFTICKRALPPLESTPGRCNGDRKVDQLHGLNASYLVDKTPDEKGLRVVFHAWFELSEEEMEQCRIAKRKNSHRKSVEIISSFSSSSSSSKRSSSFDGDSTKAQLRRLLDMAHGVTKLPDLVRRRRFGVQVPADMSSVHVMNTRCPCCTHTLGPMKLSLSAFSNRKLSLLKSNTKRCYLCGYLVCAECWSAEHMECAAGRVAGIVVCTRCKANVQACEYAEVFAGTAADREKHRGAPRVIEDSAEAPTVSLLVDFLSTSLLNTTSGSTEHAAVMAVIRTLLRQNSEDSEDESDDDSEGNSEYERLAPRFKVLGEAEAVELVGKVLSDEHLMPQLEDCKLGNADKRDYVLDLPEDTDGVPSFPVPRNETDRIATAKASGILQLANLLAPEDKEAEAKGKIPNTQDLELLCRLAVKTLGCSYSFVTVMSEKHEHVVATTNAGFAGAAIPREQTTCQHALMTPHPFVVAHHEADVRFHNHNAVSILPIRFYAGFPVQIPVVGGGSDGPQTTVAMICCVDSKPRAEITRTQYATMSRLASTAKSFLLQKSSQLLLESGP
ncbi:hypothetical protein DVH05_026380 [Phytophthora capsici]|nr:hypothetical protein DVH05_026380 [Phytophthora capsici]